MLENVYTYIAMCENMLSSMREGKFHGRETEQGTMWAVEFCKSLDHQIMSESELNHAVRLTYFRGTVCPRFNG